MMVSAASAQDRSPLVLLREGERKILEDKVQEFFTRQVRRMERNIEYDLKTIQRGVEKTEKKLGRIIRQQKSFKQGPVLEDLKSRTDALKKKEASTKRTSSSQKRLCWVPGSSKQSVNTGKGRALLEKEKIDLKKHEDAVYGVIDELKREEEKLRGNLARKRCREELEKRRHRRLIDELEAKREYYSSLNKELTSGEMLYSMCLGKRHLKFRCELLRACLVRAEERKIKEAKLLKIKLFFALAVVDLWKEEKGYDAYEIATNTVSILVNTKEYKILRKILTEVAPGEFLKKRLSII